MRFLFLLLTLILQLNVSGYNLHNPQENHVQNALTSENEDFNKRSCILFRYYDCDSGSYISQDPIGLAGNNPTLYGYVHDTNSWIDVFGMQLFSPIVWKAPSSGTGNTYKVYQREINWDYVNPDTGMTNLEWAKKDNAPLVIDKNGNMKSIELHHSRQNAKGPLFELSSTAHRARKGKGREALHPYGNKKHPENPVDRDLFGKDKSQYWMDRAKKEEIKRTHNHH